MSDECDKDSGYEPDQVRDRMKMIKSMDYLLFQHQVNIWPRAPLSGAKRANFRGKKQRSLEVHDVRQAQLLSHSSVRGDILVIYGEMLQKSPTSSKLREFHFHPLKVGGKLLPFVIVMTLAKTAKTAKTGVNG